MLSSIEVGQLTLQLGNVPSRPIGLSEARPTTSQQLTAGAAASFIDDLVLHRPDRALVSCCKQKEKIAYEATRLYCSPLFKKSMSLAERLSIPFDILSAKHGVVSSKQIIEPYDLSLNDLDSFQRKEWSRNAAAHLVEKNKCEKLMFLTGSTYSKEIAPLLANAGKEVSFPLAGMSMGMRLAFLSACHRYLDRLAKAEQTYRDFDELARNTNLPSLKEALRKDMPSHGVYFFFDPNETSRFSKSVPRLVRIGTHGVSAGSKATLKHRLRTHLGTMSGTGNHRSSIFRLHVGQAMIARQGLQKSFLSWGKPAMVPIKAEQEIEREVSTYIGQLLVLWVGISDEPNKESARAFVEKNVISLFSEDRVALEHPSEKWLGHNSRHSIINESGLWNIRCVGDKCDLTPGSLLFGFENGHFRTKGKDGQNFLRL